MYDLFPTSSPVSLCWDHPDPFGTCVVRLQLRTRRGTEGAVEGRRPGEHERAGLCGPVPVCRGRHRDRARSGREYPGTGQDVHPRACIPAGLGSPVGEGALRGVGHWRHGAGQAVHRDPEDARWFGAEEVQADSDRLRHHGSVKDAWRKLWAVSAEPHAGDEDTRLRDARSIRLEDDRTP